MTYDDCIDTIYLLLSNPEFKNLSALQKHLFQKSKLDEDREIRRIMYEGLPGNSEAAKKSHITRKANAKNANVNKRAAASRRQWYKDPKNREKFEEAIRKRDAKKKGAK